VEKYRNPRATEGESIYTLGHKLGPTSFLV